jgi:hypothetical protein
MRKRERIERNIALENQKQKKQYEQTQPDGRVIKIKPRPLTRVKKSNFTIFNCRLSSI